MAKNKDARRREKFIVEHQLNGGTFAVAMEIWNASSEITDTLMEEGIRTEDDLSPGMIADVIADWKDVRKVGL